MIWTGTTTIRTALISVRQLARQILIETSRISPSDSGRSRGRVPSVVAVTPSADRVAADRHHDGARHLVVPRLLLLVPQHPEVAQQQHDGGDEAADVADERAGGADRSAAREIDDADPERLLADRLAGGAALEVCEVDDAGEEVR